MELNRLRILLGVVYLMIASQVATAARWNPGFYVQSGRNTLASKASLQPWLNQSQVAGYSMKTRWRTLEPQKDVYDFTIIDQSLAHMRGLDKQLFVGLFIHASDSPVYLYDEGNMSTNRSGVKVPQIWKPGVMDRYIKLIREIGKRYDADPNFEGLFTYESCNGVDIGTDGYSREAYFGFQWPRMIQEVSPDFNESIFFPMLSCCPDAYQGVLGQAILDNGAGVTWPDTLKGRELGGFDLARQYKGRIPIASGGDDTFYRANMSFETDVYDFAANDLGANYILFGDDFTPKNGDTRPGYQQEIFNLMASHPEFGVTMNAGCPENQVCRGDYDADGDTDGRDFLLWQRNPSSGSLAEWQNNYGSGSPLVATARAVPEPSGFLSLFYSNIFIWIGLGRHTRWFLCRVPSCCWASYQYLLLVGAALFCSDSYCPR